MTKFERAWIFALASTLALACGVRRSEITDATSSSGEDTQTTAPASSSDTDASVTSDPITDATAGDDTNSDSDSDSGSDTSDEPACGDGVVDPGERCDDGNTDANDLCSADCRNPVVACGNVIYACGDTLDNDGDGLVDLDDPECISPCDDAEDVLRRLRGERTRRSLVLGKHMLSEPLGAPQHSVARRSELHQPLLARSGNPSELRGFARLRSPVQFNLLRRLSSGSRFGKMPRR